MVNVGTGNMLLQADDMSVPHKGIALAFRRTYNAQSLHDASGDDGTYPYGTFPSMYGTGWTNTFDAHLARTADGTVWSVFDIDGARYDYSHVPNTYTWTPPPGQHATLTYDGSCGMLWTKKSGTTYYFYRPSASASCPSLAQVGGYAGRLYEIAGRNQNAALSFTYSWLNGDASATGKIAQIDVTAESGLRASLRFGPSNGFWLLSSLTRPDGAAIGYGYDTVGNLTSVTLPPNNGTAPSFSDGLAPVQTYGYENSGTRSYLAWAASPRWSSAPGGCSGDLKTGCGAYLLFRYAYGASPTTTGLVELDRYGFMDPTPTDGTGTPIQPMPGGGSAVATAPALSEYYTLGQLGATSTPTFRDTDGHATNWVTDATGRTTQTQECTATQSQQCTGAYLVTNSSWDTSNNLVANTDPRGFETDYAYDANGNGTAVGEPSTTTSQGSFRPTKLYDYDKFNNVISYCDETASHANGGRGDWTSAGPPTAGGPDALCATNGSSMHAVYTFPINPAPASEPFGRLTNIRSPLGYNRTITYAPAQQGGADYGLPTSVVGDSFAQLDGTTVTPTQSLWYDAHGNLRCYDSGNGTSVLSYDSLGRMTSVADPDDSSANAASTCGKSTGQPGWNTQTTYEYFPDGSKRSSQLPSERSFGVSTTFAYDADGDVISEDRHHGCVANNTCLAGTTHKWYDGANRLVEVAQPHDAQPPSSDGDPWMTRYVYDLSQGNTVSVSGAAEFRASGNLFKTQTYVRDASATLAWQDVRGSAFDALDREVQQYSYTVSDHQLRTGYQEFDRTSSTLGLRWRKTNPTGEQATYIYDELMRVVNIAYSGDNGNTPGEAFTFDPSGRQASATSTVFGTEQRTYDAEGRLRTVAEPTGGGLTDPARLDYSYYGNGSTSALSVSSQTFTQPNAITYSYRPDGKLQTQSVNAFQSGTWTKTYTAGGRLQSSTGIDQQSRTYDSTGQLATYTLAGMTITYPAHDPEGNVQSVVFPHFPFGSGTNPSPIPETLTNVVNLRGELIGQSYSPNPNYALPARASTTNSGYRDTRSYSQDPSVMPPDSSTDIDFLNGIAVGSSSNTSSGNGDYQNSRTSFTFDAGGRQLQTSQITDTATTVTDDNTGLSRTITAHVDAESHKTYDTENHTHSIRQTATSTRNGAPQAPTDWTSTIGWGPNGHPVQFRNDQGSALALHWDGDALLFVSDASGTVVDFKVGTDGETAPGNTGGVTVYDRDTAGVVVMTSNATGNSGLEPLDSSDLSGSYPATSGYQAPTRNYFDTDRADGYGFGTFRINGARAFDATLGSWTTPDAYAGNVHDPATQQRYMWNRNNPYEYSDPSGYFPEQVLADGVSAAAGPTAAASEASDEADEGEPITVAASGRPRPGDEPHLPGGRTNGGKPDALSKFERALKHALHLDGAVSKLPARTVGIDQTKFTRWHTQIKRRAELSGRDDAFINLDTKDLWSRQPDGTYINHGNVYQFFQPDKK